MLRIAILVAIGIAIVASVTAQEPASRGAVASPEKDQIVVTGCVQRAAQLPTGTSGTVGAVGEIDSSKFILAKASPADGKAAAAAPPTYKLDADDSLLATHVGHKVEITGILDSKAMPGAASDPALAASSGSTLKVTAVKMIAAACE